MIPKHSPELHRCERKYPPEGLGVDEEKVFTTGNKAGMDNGDAIEVPRCHVDRTP